MNAIANETLTSNETEQVKKGRSTSRRAELLAERIEEGAATLAAFAEDLSEAEWRTPVSESGNRRPLGRSRRPPCRQRLPH